MAVLPGYERFRCFAPGCGHVRVSDSTTDGSNEAVAAVEEAVRLSASDGTIYALSVLEELPMYRRAGKARKFEDETGPAQQEHAEDVGADAIVLSADDLVALLVGRASTSGGDRATGAF